jgi:hypothetical protein
VRFLELDSLQRQPRTLASQRPETR